MYLSVSMTFFCRLLLNYRNTKLLLVSHFLHHLFFLLRVEPRRKLIIMVDQNVRTRLGSHCSQFSFFYSFHKAFFIAVHHFLYFLGYQTLFVSLFCHEFFHGVRIVLFRPIRHSHFHFLLFFLQVHLCFCVKLAGGTRSRGVDFRMFIFLAHGFVQISYDCWSAHQRCDFVLEKRFPNVHQRVHLLHSSLS